VEGAKENRCGFCSTVILEPADTWREKMRGGVIDPYNEGPIDCECNIDFFNSNRRAAG
jgi:hypothetical protein